MTLPADMTEIPLPDELIDTSCAAGCGRYADKRCPHCGICVCMGLPEDLRHRCPAPVSLHTPRHGRHEEVPA